MKKEYQKPEVNMISLSAQERIAEGDELIDGEVGLESSIFD